MKKIKLSLVIPCYRSAGTVESVVREIEQTIAQRIQEYDYEIILVNDGSPDNTAEVLAEICETHPHTVFVNLTRNFGQHAAVMAGFHQVSGDIVICLDDDGQTPADELFKLVDKMDEGYDLVYARYPQKKHNWFRNLGSKFNSWCNEIILQKPRDLFGSSYFACRRFLVDTAIEYKNPFPYIGGLLCQSTRKYANVDVAHRAREEGSSGYSLKKLLSLWSNGFTAFSVIPLRIATFCGLGFAIIGFITALLTSIRKLFHPAIPAGWSSVMAVLLIVGGIIMLMLGMLGEYIGRIYMSINNLPQYVVREIKDNRRADNAEGK